MYNVDNKSFKLIKRKRIIKKTSGDDHDNKDDPGGQSTGSTEKEEPTTKKEIPNQGKLKLDYRRSIHYFPQ